MADSNLNIPIRGNKISLRVEASAHLASVQSPFQRIDVYDTEVFGKVLLLDGHVQLAELDEAAYHEALVQIPMLSIADPKRALVVGGGDGGALRELCKHRGLERIDMAEIDEAVVRICREHLPEVSAGAFDDPRVQLHICDAFEFVKAAGEPYDLIVLDATDVYEDEEGELSEKLFTEGFYRDCLSVLSDGGIVVTQADNPVFCPYSLEGVLDSFAKVFPASGSYWALVPSFGGYSGFAWGSKGIEPKELLPVERARGIRLSYLTESTYALGMGPLPF